jgi:hypothetical protein
MSSIRTQIYLTVDQRHRIDEVITRDGGSMAEVIRRALDQYLDGANADQSAALDDTFGRLPELTVPSRDEWSRG